MTGGTVVILGAVGGNFAAGMTGGMAFVYDPDDSFALKLNEDSVIYQRIEVEHYANLARDLIAQHVKETQSVYAETILRNWDLEMPKFWQVVPKEMLDKLEHPVRAEQAVAVAGE